MNSPITRWPWISLVIAGVMVASPVGREFLDAAFISNDQLGQNIARPIVLIALAIALVTVLSEFLLRSWLHRNSGQ